MISPYSKGCSLILDHIFAWSFLYWIVVMCISVLTFHHWNSWKIFTTDRDKEHWIAIMSWGQSRGSVVSGQRTSSRTSSSGKKMLVLWSVCHYSPSWSFIFLQPTRTQANVEIHCIQQAKSLWFADEGLVLYIAGVVSASPQCLFNPCNQ